MSSSEHEAFIKTPKQLITVVLLAFVVPILLIIFLSQLVTGGMKTSPSNPELNADAVRSRITPVAQLKLAGADGPKVLQTGEQVYKAVCAACHQAGLLNAPKVGDTGTWGKLIKEGLKTITADAIKGIRQMPARGGNPDLEDIEVERAIVYMANLSGAKWTEPAAAAAGATPAAAAAAPAAPPATAAGMGMLPAKVFFEVGKFAIPADGLKAIASAAGSLKAGTGKVDITGYTDKSGNAEQNVELAKERAKAVREALEKAGIARDRINMRPPVEITGGQNDNEARRVEINSGV